MSEVLIENQEKITFITLNRPEKRNALNDALINSLKNALLETGGDENFHAVVIKGAGKDFCSGADLSALRKIAESDVLENLWDAENLMELFQIIRKIIVECSLFVLDDRHGTNIISAVPYRYGARSDGLRSVERDAEVRKVRRPHYPRGSVVQEGGRGDHGGGNGRHE